MGMHEKPAADLRSYSGRDVFVSGFTSVEIVGGSCIRLVPFVVKDHERMEAEDAIVLPLSACTGLISLLVGAARLPLCITEEGKIVFLH